jgi:hypothetical protein
VSALLRLLRMCHVLWPSVDWISPSGSFGSTVGSDAAAPEVPRTSGSPSPVVEESAEVVVPACVRRATRPSLLIVSAATP